MRLDEEYSLEELEEAVEGLNNPLESAVKNPEVYRDATEALSQKIGSYDSGMLHRMLEEPEASQQQLGFFSSAMEELGLVHDSDGSRLNREYGSPQNVWANYREKDFWEGLREDLDTLYSDEVETAVSRQS
ncbi:MAG: hypothetical protein ABEK04_04195 [Candidatus Nanohalobium sp.]